MVVATSSRAATVVAVTVVATKHRSASAESKHRARLCSEPPSARLCHSLVNP